MFWATAQDTDKEDPYSDYSYLWEDSKAKAKEEKRKAKEETKTTEGIGETPKEKDFFLTPQLFKDLYYCTGFYPFRQYPFR